MSQTTFKLISTIAVISTLIVSVGCERKDPNHPNLDSSDSSFAVVASSVASSIQQSSSSAASSFTAVTAAEPADFATDAWVGDWNGPEGTFLKIEGDKGVYTLTIQNLDGHQTYEGKTLGDRIQFEREGTIETIHVSDGKDTGMKWLADKSNCLIIREGEGFCRD